MVEDAHHIIKQGGMLAQLTDMSLRIIRRSKHARIKLRSLKNTGLGTGACNDNYGKAYS